MATCLLVLLILAATAVFGLAPCTADNAISSRDTLYCGQFLTTGKYQFIMQTDCNLVLYDCGKPIWATQTSGVAFCCRAVMQEDGNIVIYDNRGRPVWASKTAGPIANYALVLQKDRNVVIYGPAIGVICTQKGTVGVTVVAQNSTNPTAAAAQVIVSVA